MACAQHPRDWKGFLIPVLPHCGADAGGQHVTNATSRERACNALCAGIRVRGRVRGSALTSVRQQPATPWTAWTVEECLQKSAHAFLEYVPYECVRITGPLHSTMAQSLHE